MPNYDYFCTNCEYEEEILQKMTDERLTKCPHCQQSTFNRKVGGGIGLQFQGSGFYKTDYGTPSPEKKSSSSIDPQASGSQGCCCGKPSCSA